MKAYRVTTYKNDIVEIDADKFTDKSIFIKGNRAAMVSEWYCYFESFEEARRYMIECFRKEQREHEAKINTLMERIDAFTMLIPSPPNPDL